MRQKGSMNSAVNSIQRVLAGMFRSQKKVLSKRIRPILTEIVDGMLRASIGKAQLLLNKRFPQFLELCQMNKDPSASLSARDTDLEGYWDLIS